MALLDFMKQGTQWLTDNTGMDWNTVQRDPGLAAKRLMGGEVSPYQAQPQTTQDNLLSTPENIVPNPAMQNRMTYNSPQSEAEFFPDYRTVQNDTNFNYTPTIDGGYNLPIRTFEDEAENARANDNSLYGNYQDTNGYDRNRKEGQGVVNAIAEDYANRVTYQNLPQKKADYEAGLLAEDKLYGDYPMTGFTEIAPGLRASEPIKGGYSEVDLINEDNQRKFEEEQDAIKQAEKDKESFEFNPHQNMTVDGFRPTPNGKPNDVVNFDQNDLYRTNEVITNNMLINSDDRTPREFGSPFAWLTKGLPGFGKNDEGYAVDKNDYDHGTLPHQNIGPIPDLQNIENKLELPENAKFKLDKAKRRAAEIDSLDEPDAIKIELYQEAGIPVPDKYGMKGLLSTKK